jgi:pantothenate kinase
MHETPIAELAARIDALLADGQRHIIGLTGPPGSGKSTLAQTLFGLAPARSVVVPMDGFHLANCELARLGRSERKGAEDTFDSAGYVALLHRIRTAPPNQLIYAPDFRREIEEAIAGAIAIQPEHRLVLTEGNYLLLEAGNWGAVRSLVDEIWYVEVDDAVRLQRLIARHIAFGRAEAAAREWVARTDEPNAALIAAHRARADLVVRR